MTRATILAENDGTCLHFNPNIQICPIDQQMCSTQFRLFIRLFVYTFEALKQIQFLDNLMKIFITTELKFRLIKNDQF